MKSNVWNTLDGHRKQKQTENATMSDFISDRSELRFMSSDKYNLQVIAYISGSPSKERVLDLFGLRFDYGVGK